MPRFYGLCEKENSLENSAYTLAKILKESLTTMEKEMWQPQKGKKEIRCGGGDFR